MLKIPSDLEKDKVYYSGVIFTFHTENTGDTFKTTSEIASMLYIEPEDLIPQAEINDFSVNKKIIFSPEVDLSVSVQNTGEAYFQPRGFIEIYDPNGVRQNVLLTFNDNLKFMLKNQTYSENFSWAGLLEDGSEGMFPKIGSYKAVFTLYLDKDQNNKLQKEVTYFFIPLEYVVAVLLILGISVFSIVFVRLRRMISFRKSH